MAKEKAKPFVIAYGEEDFLLDRTLALGKAWKDRSTFILDGNKLSDGELVSVCESTSYDGRSRVVILDNAQKLSGKASLEEYIKAKDPTDSSVVLVAALRSDKISEVWQAAAAKGTLYHCERFKPWQAEKTLARIAKEASRLGLRLGEGVAESLHQLVGSDLGLVVNELRKISHLLGSGATVEKQHVLLVVPPRVPVEPKQIVEAAFEKKPLRALERISWLYRNRGDVASVLVTSALLYQVEKLLVARQMLDKGDSTAIIASSLGMHEFACAKNLLPLARKHEVARLCDHMKMLCRLDTLVKGPALSKRTHVELAVLSIAA